MAATMEFACGLASPRPQTSCSTQTDLGNPPQILLLRAQQIIETQDKELTEKNRLIADLGRKLELLSGLASAVADDTRSLAATAAAAFSPSCRQQLHHQEQQERSQTASPAACGRTGRLGPCGGFKLEGSSDGPERQPRSPAGFSAFTRMSLPPQPQREQLLMAHAGLNAAAALDLAGAATAEGLCSCSGHSGLNLLLQQQHGVAMLGMFQQHGAAAAAAEAEAAAAAGAARVVAGAAKRPRIHSNGSAVGEGAGCGTVQVKRAVSGGSTSSHHLLSTDEELPDEQDEVNGAAAGARGRKQQQRQVSPGSIDQQLQQPDERMAYDDELTERGDEEQSQDEREAASQLLAMFQAATTSSPTTRPAKQQQHQPSAAGAGSRPGLREGRHLLAAMQPGVQQHWPAGSGSSWAQSTQGVPHAACPWHGGHEAFKFNSHHQPPPLFGLPEQQQLPPLALQHFGGGEQMCDGRRRSETVDATWGLPGKTTAHYGGGSASSGRPRKQSWFQTEIAEKIPLAVQQACSQDWAAQHCMQVVCADLSGTFYVNSGGEYLIKLPNGEVVSPNKFEEIAGKKTARNWQQSIRLVGYTMNGEPSSALLKLGHFTRIVGLVQDR